MSLKLVMMVVRFEDLAILVELVIWLCVVLNGWRWGWRSGRSSGARTWRWRSGSSIRGEGGAERRDGGGS